MLFFIAIAIASIIGIVTGIIKKNKVLVILCAVPLVMVVAVWVYFYNNPY